MASGPNIFTSIAAIGSPADDTADYRKGYVFSGKYPAEAERLYAQSLHHTYLFFLALEVGYHCEAYRHEDYRNKEHAYEYDEYRDDLHHNEVVVNVASVGCCYQRESLFFKLVLDSLYLCVGVVLHAYAVGGEPSDAALRKHLVVLIGDYIPPQTVGDIFLEYIAYLKLVGVARTGREPDDIALLRTCTERYIRRYGNAAVGNVERLVVKVIDEVVLARERHNALQLAAEDVGVLFLVVVGEVQILKIYQRHHRRAPFADVVVVLENLHGFFAYLLAVALVSHRPEYGVRTVAQPLRRPLAGEVGEYLHRARKYKYRRDRYEYEQYHVQTFFSFKVAFQHFKEHSQSPYGFLVDIIISRRSLKSP